MNEEWRPLIGVEGIEGQFLISNMGRVRRIVFTHPNQKEYPAITKQHKDYRYVMFYKDNKPKCCRLHRLVALAFIPNPNNYPEINHIDGDKGNNCVSNLEWCSKSQNQLHKFRVLGYDGPTKGKHLSDETKAKLRAFQLGHKVSDETRAKMSAAMKRVRASKHWGNF